MSEPLFSVVVPAYGVQAVLRDCLDSILAQSCADFEVVAVDDRSIDHSGAILDAYAAVDHRVHVVHLSENVGLGHARQAGLERCVGRYVLFVDADDWVPQGSFEAIAARLQETDEPDILIVDYERVYWDGGTLRNTRHDLLARPGPEVFTADDRPDLLTLLMVVWNKAYRRDFLTEHGFAFGPGYYEDLPWTYPTMLTARRIAILDRVCISYRQRRSGNILRSPGRKHFDVFDQYDRIFAFIDADPELEHWRAFMLRRMMEHLATIMVRSERVGRHERREFFERAHGCYVRYRTGSGYTRPGRLTGIKIRLIEGGRYRLYAPMQGAARVVGKVRVGLRSAKSTLRAAARVLLRQPWHQLPLLYYRVQRLRPLDPQLAVYAAYWYRAPACNPLAIYRKAAELVPQVRGVWVVQDEDRERVPAGLEVVSPGSRAYYRVLATAGVLVNNVNFPNEVVKRPGSLHVQTHHGTPLKMMGLDLQAYPDGANGMNFERLLQRCDRWDLSLSSNPYSSEVWERAYPAGFTTMEAGYPRNDVLVSADDARVAAVRAALGIDDGVTAVLYATTHRDYQDGYEPVVDVDRLAEALGPGIVLLVRTHYYHGAEGFGSGGHERVIDVSAHPAVEDLYLAADVLVTDYSSVMFDYAVLDRPIVIFAPDWERYRRSRGTYFDLVALPPGVVVTTADALAETLRSGDYASPAADLDRAEFRRLFCGFDDGRAAERVVQVAFGAAPVEPPDRDAPVVGVPVMTRAGDHRRSVSA